MSILYNAYSGYPNLQPIHIGLKKMNTDDDQLLPQPKCIRLIDPEESDPDSDDDASHFDPNAYYNTASQDTTAKCVSEFMNVAFKNVSQERHARTLQKSFLDQR